MEISSDKVRRVVTIHKPDGFLPGYEALEWFRGQANTYGWEYEGFSRVDIYRIELHYSLVENGPREV